MEKLEAIRKLREHDHGILSIEGAESIAEPFGVKVPIQRFTDTRSRFKGVTLYGNKEGDKAEGVSAHLLAEAIAKKECDFEPFQMGIGSRLRTACDQVECFLTTSELLRKNATHAHQQAVLDSFKIRSEK